MNDLFDKCLQFATKKHLGQFRVGGAPYITHPVAVCQMLKDKGYPLNYQITALFHDLLEDTDCTEQEILALGGAEVLCAVKLLTKTKGADYGEYMQGVLSNEMAKTVKTYDRIHNLRSAVVADNGFKIRYVEQTKKYYTDFIPEVIEEANKLQKTVL